MTDSLDITGQVRRLRHLSFLLYCTAAWMSTVASANEPMTLRAYMELSGPAPTAHIAYGSAPSQYVELFLPEGNGPFPVAVLVHGGCWVLRNGGIEQMRNPAAALIAQGIAVWSVEYRRLDETGGGYPGTYLDMSAALDTLTVQAASYRLDTQRLVAIGHSAGGFLVQWAAGRARLPASSPLYEPHPLPIREVISLGGLGDLRRQRGLVRDACARDVGELTGRPSAGRPDVYLDTSPAELLPNGSHIVLINGQLDTIVPPQVAIDFARRARKAGDAAETVILPRASHFDEIAATSPAWNLILPFIQKALGID